MIRILLIRHASNDMLGRVLYGRMPGVHLNTEGLRQAELLAQASKQQYTLDAVISSPLERALETAEPLAEAHRAPLVIDEGLNEINVGEWLGKSFGELNGFEDWKRFNRRRSTVHPPAGESMIEVQGRAWRSIEAIYERHGDGSTVALVTHGDIIRCLLMLLLGMPVDHIHRLEISPASLTEVILERDEPLLKLMNRIYY